MVGGLGVEEVQGLPTTLPDSPEPGKRVFPRIVSRPGSQVCCFGKMPEGLAVLARNHQAEDQGSYFPSVF